MKEKKFDAKIWQDLGYLKVRSTDGQLESKSSRTRRVSGNARARVSVSSPEYLERQEEKGEENDEQRSHVRHCVRA
jgi:hypothetical protein